MMRPQVVGEASQRVAANLREMLGADAALTYAEIARQLTAAGLPTSTMTALRIVRGERRITVDELVALAAIVGVEPVQLWSGTARTTTTITWRDIPPAGNSV
jgi:plasmid maintenance system antidote protein VapI